MFCPKCGDKIEADERFCNKCGNRLDSLTNGVKNNINASNFNNQNGGSNNLNNTINFSNTNNNQSSSLSNNTSDPVLTPINNNLNQVNNSSNNTNQSNSSIDVKRQHDIKMHNIINKRKKEKTMIIIGVVSFACILIFAVVIVSMLTKTNYYFSEETYEDNNEITYTSGSTYKNKYSTVIITDNTYSGVKISNSTDALNLISKDSTDQKSNCPSNIKAIEERIIKNYGITAVNLCEMDIGFAEEIEKVFKTIYDEYPSVRGYLTNVTLINAPMSQGYIAAFMPMFSFATADSPSGYPYVMKTQVLLNTTYFLNPSRLSDSVKDASNSGHFPPNTTIYSPVAHELGHYLSFLSMMRHYDMESLLLIDNNNVDKLYSLYDDFAKGDFSLSMITEAYNNCKKDNKTTLQFDEWRATISNYAVAKDNSGNYIYDETIAEAFHDVYLNGNNAQDASKYVVAVLKKKLEG